MFTGHNAASVAEKPADAAVTGLVAALADHNKSYDRLFSLLLALVFVLSTAACLWFNFGSRHVEYSFIGDSGGYTEEADQCLTLWRIGTNTAKIAISGHADAGQIRSILQDAGQRLPDLRMNGPVWPVLLASVFGVCGTDPGARGWHPQNWYIPVLAQCFLMGLNSVLIALVGRRLWNRSVGIVAGLIAALYPGFIVNSPRLTTEPFACTLMLTLVLLVCELRKSKHPWVCGYLMGALLTVSQLTRSVLVLQWLFVVPIALWKLRLSTILKIALATSVAAVIFTAPWLAWQQARFGQPKPLLDRAGIFNLYVGNDPDRQGWLSLPPLAPPEITKWSNTDVIVRSWKASPQKFIRLQFDKPPRMFKTLWNDFRTAIGPVTYEWQVFWHQVIMVLAVIGAVVSVYDRKGDSRLIPRLVLLDMLALHAVYFVFAPVARYNLTAMPALILFASAAAVCLVKFARINRRPVVVALAATTLLMIGLRVDQWQLIYDLTVNVSANTVAVVVSILKFVVFAAFLSALYLLAAKLQVPSLSRRAVFALALLLFPFLVLPLRTYGRLEERTVELSGANSVIQRDVQILPDELIALKTGQPYVVIDAPNLDFVNNRIKISVNGQPLNAGAIPGGALLDCGHYGEIPPLYNYRDGIFGVFSYSTGISNTNLRQWFFVPVDSKVLTENNGAVRITVEPKSEDGQPPRLFATQRGQRGFWSLPSFTIYSFDKAFYGSETDNGVSDPRFDDHIPVNKSDMAKVSVPNVFLFVAPPVSLDPDKQKVVLAQKQEYPAVRLRGSGRTIAVFNFDGIEQPGLDDVVYLRVRGKVRSDAQVEPGIDVQLKMEKTKDDPRERAVADYAPRLLPVGKDWRIFDVLIPFSRRSFFDKPFTGFAMHVNATAHSRKIYNEYPTDDGLVEFKDLALEIYRAPGNPIAQKSFRIF